MKTSALILCGEEYWDDAYGPVERKRLEALLGTPIRVHSQRTLAEHPRELAEAEVILSCWGMAYCDEAFFARAPKLKAIFYAAGTIRGFVTDALWKRDIIVSTSNSALSVTVAEFALAQIILSLKGFWRHAAETREQRQMVRHTPPGTYDSVVGLISIGAIARNLLVLLKSFHFKVIAYDPFLSEEEARELGIELVTLEEIFELSHVVSLHTPWLPETEGMIRGHHFSRMREGATFINTARGAVVNEAEMAEVLARRPDLHALLDVIWPEPAPPSSTLYDLPNVVMTPHIAGAMGTECRRLGAMAVDEFERYLKGRPLLGQVREEMMATIA